MKRLTLEELRTANAETILAAVQRIIPNGEAVEQLAYALAWTRFWAKVTENPETGCWEWTGASHHGYGSFAVKPKSYDAHRLAWLFLRGPIPDGLSLDHLRDICQTTLCVNAYVHLQAVTPKENVFRGRSALAKKASQTHCIRAHEFDGIDRRGHRTCSLCAQLREKNRSPRSRRRNQKEPNNDYTI